MLTTELIEHILATIPHRTIGLLGDLFLDRYLDIDPARDEPSIETGLTAYQVTRVRSYPGALGTVLNNLAALGVGRIYPIAILGDDGEGYELRQTLQRLPGVELGGLVTAPDRRTPTYTKPMYGDRELNRLDIKNRTPTSTSLEDAVMQLLDEAWPHLDALVVLDQVTEEDCGVVTKRVRDRLAWVANSDPNKFVLADSRERIGQFRNVCVKPNSEEWEKAYRWGNFERGFFEALQSDDSGSMIFANVEKNSYPVVFLTGGSLGILVKHYRPAEMTTVKVPAYRVTCPIDICGAGDSCSAGITSAMVAGATHEQAAAFGNLVASITIQQIGTTGTASPEQVRQRWREVQSAS